MQYDIFPYHQTWYCLMMFLMFYFKLIDISICIVWQLWIRLLNIVTSLPPNIHHSLPRMMFHPVDVSASHPNPNSNLIISRTSLVIQKSHKWQGNAKHKPNLYFWLRQATIHLFLFFFSFVFYSVQIKCFKHFSYPSLLNN